jgi:hypothetical protein
MFDYRKLKELQDSLKKQAFVPIDSKSAQAAPPDAGMMPPPGAVPPDAGMMPPDAGMTPPPGAPPPDAGMMPPPDAGMAPPMDPSMMAGDPAAGLPPPPEGGDVSPDGEPYMKITPTQFFKFLKQYAALMKGTCDGDVNSNNGGGGGAGNDTEERVAALDAKLDAILPMLAGGAGAGGPIG